MPYEFNEIRFLYHEGEDWWQTIKKFPIKILDQDFGVEVSKSDLTDLTTGEKPKQKDGTSSKGKYEQEKSEKILDIDSFKRKDAVKKPSYSKVTLGSDYFEAEIFSNQFVANDFHVRIIKGFLVIDASREETTGDVTVWRRFQRRYMLPYDCHVSNLINQIKTDRIEGGVRVRVYKINLEDAKRSPGKPSILKPPGQSSPPLKSPPKEKDSILKKTLSSPLRSPKEKDVQLKKT